MNRFVFIDGGAHIFETANTCWDNSGNVTYDKNYTDPNSPMDWRIVDPLVNPVLFFDKDINTHIKDVEFHLFEPNNFKNNTTMNILKEKIKNIEDKFNINVNLYENAISTNNEPQNFYQAIDKWGDVGSTLNSDKLEKLDLENPLLVNCIDICEFIKTFSLDDYIVLKLDVEGGEFDILMHLIKNDLLKRINLLYIEWHVHFFPNKKHEFLYILNYIKDNNINYRPWYY